MGDATTVGDLLVRIGGNTDALVDAAKRAGKSLQDLDASGGRVKAGMQASTLIISAAVAMMSRAIVSAIDASINRLVDLGKTSQQIGVPVEQLSRLEFAAKKAGVSTDELSQGVKLFARQAGEIRSSIEAPDDFSRALTNLKVNLGDTNQKVRPTVDLLLDLSDRFSKMPDGVQKTSLSMQLFGRSGAEMIPFLNMGRDKLQEFMAASDAMGLTVDKGATESALRFSNSLRSLSNTFDVVFRAVAKEYLPQIESLVTWLNSMVKSSGAASSSMEGLRVVFDTIISVGKLIVVEVINAVNALGLLIKAGKQLASGDFTGAWETVKRTVADTTGYWTEAADKVGAFSFATKGAKDAVAAFGAASKWAATVTPEGFKVAEQTAAQAAEAHKKAREEYVKGLITGPGTEQTVFAMQNLNRALSIGKISWTEYTMAADLALGAHRQGNLNALETSLSQVNALVSEKRDALETAVKDGTISFAQFSKQMTELNRDQMRDGLDNVMSSMVATAEQKKAALQKALNEGAISYQQYGNSVRDVERQNQQNMLDTASLAATTLTTMFKENKAAAIAAAVINTAVGITRAFRDLPAPIAWIQSGLIAATGAAQIAQISSTSQDGGGGTTAASSGNAGAAAQASGPAAPSQTIFASGFSPAEFMRGDVVEALAKELVKYQRDGGTVVFQGA